MIIIVKRKGHKEDFDIKKVYASVYAACLNVDMHEGEAELIADKVSSEVEIKLQSEEEVTSTHILKLVADVLRK